MTVAPDHLSPRRLGAWALSIAALVAGLVVLFNAGRWLEHDGVTSMRLLSQAQSERCLTARGLQVTSAGERRLRVTGASGLDVTLTFYPTYEQAHAEVWDRAEHGPRVTRKGARGGAWDTVTFRAVSELDDRKVRLFSSCVGRQPVRARVRAD